MGSTGPDSGRCYGHTQRCGGGVGAFLLLRATRVLLLHGSRAAMVLSPYVDAHGEEDIHLHRGR